MKYALLLTLLALVFAGCDRPSPRKTDSGIPDKPTDTTEVSPAEAEVGAAKAYSQFVDVRTPEEYAAGHAARSVNIPLDTLPDNLPRLEKSEPVYLICQIGQRSKEAADLLKKAGFNNVFNVTGGLDAWQAAGLPMEKLPPHRVPPVPISNNGPRS